MSHPAYLSIHRVTCFATEDWVGSDDLYAVIGMHKFALGNFTAGTTLAPGVQERPIVPGITRMQIFESDFPDDDDFLADVDLFVSMDQDRTVRFNHDGASYELQLRVQSEPDQ